MRQVEEGGTAMDAATAPAPGASGADALEILESLMASLAGVDPAELADEEKARRLRCWSGSTR